MERGFSPMLDSVPTVSMERNNNLSARKAPAVVSKAIRQELDKGYILGPYQSPPYKIYRVSPLGLAEGKYSGTRGNPLHTV